MAEEKRVNLKAQKFEAYTQANKMDFFVKNEMKDDADTVVFQSNLKVEGQTIPLGIITDNTIYTIIRVQIGSQLLKDENKLALLEYLNQLNRSYKVFKYVAAEDGSISSMRASRARTRALTQKSSVSSLMSSSII